MGTTYSAEIFEQLFELPPQEASGNSKGLVYRTRTITAGQFKYVDVYPVISRGQVTEARARAAKKSTKSQEKLNAWHSQMKLEQLINNNFCDEDIFITLTYRDNAQPDDYASAMKDINKFIRKVRRMREKRELSELRYCYCIESTESEKRGLRFHFHMITGGDGISRDELETLWTNGIANTRRCKADENGLAGLAHYMSKAMKPVKEGCRRWNASRNLKKPKETRSDTKLSARKVERIFNDLNTAGVQILQQAHKGYQLVGDIYARRSDYLPGGYIRFKLRRFKRT